MYTLYFNKVDLKAQKEGTCEIGKPKLSNNTRPSELTAHVPLFCAVKKKEKKQEKAKMSIHIKMDK